MQAMLLAAGLGKRLRPLTASLPKPLITVHGKPLIVHHIERLSAIGCRRIVINVHHLAEQIMAYLGDGGRWGVEIFYSYEDELQDTGGGIIKALPLFIEHQPLIIVSADIFTSYPFELLLEQQNKLAYLVMVPNPSYHANGDYDCRDQQILHASFPPYTYGNIGIFSPALFKTHAKQGTFPLRRVLDVAITAQQVSGEVYNGVWYNIGTLDELQACQQQVNQSTLL